MTTTTIPERTFITCDCCKRKCGNETGQARRSMSGGLIVQRDALDFQGCAVADGSVKRDLCDSCLHAVSEAINEVCQRIAHGIPPSTTATEKPADDADE